MTNVDSRKFAIDSSFQPTTVSVQPCTVVMCDILGELFDIGLTLSSILQFTVIILLAI